MIIYKTKNYDEMSKKAANIIAAKFALTVYLFRLKWSDGFG